MPVQFNIAEATLRDLFEAIQPHILQNTTPSISANLIPAFDILFAQKRPKRRGQPGQSETPASYREALLGIALVRLQDSTVNLRLPYVNQGPTAYNGRDLDEQVVNPFMQTHRIPSSRGPYLAMFRRDFQFDVSRRAGQRNKPAFDAFLDLITALESMSTENEIKQFIEYLLYRFAKHREASDIPLSRLQRISLEQFDTLLTALLNTPSGGRLPVMIVLAAFRSIRDYFAIDWKIDYQDINTADAPSGAGGDITITQDGRIVFAAEVTERPLDRARVVATFNAKIAVHGIEDYLFFVRPETLSEEAKHQARQYLAQQHEVNFLDIRNWVLMVLATMGLRGRDLFKNHLLGLLDDATTPRALKVAWNDYIAALTAAE